MTTLTLIWTTTRCTAATASAVPAGCSGLPTRLRPQRRGTYGGAAARDESIAAILKGPPRHRLSDGREIMVGGGGVPAAG